MSGQHFVVLAARGRVGRLVCAHLHEDGHRVTAVTSDATAAKALTAQGYTGLVADIRAPETLHKAFSEADGVFLATADAQDQCAVEIALIEAMQVAGVPFVVKLSAQSAGLTPPVSFGKDHIKVERALAASGMAHTILRPTFFLQSLQLFAEDVIKSGKIIAPTGKGKVAMVDVRDIAACAVAALTGPRQGTETYTLTGPSAHDFGEVAAHLSGLLDRKVTHISPPGFVARLALPFKTGMPRWQSNLAVDLMDALREGAQSEVSGDVAATLGRPATSLATYLEDHQTAFRPK